MEPFAEPFHITDATPEDVNAISKLLSSGKVQYFGQTRRRKAITAEDFFQHYITHRFLVYISEKNPTLIGYAEVSNSPDIPALPEDCWTDWLTFHYCTQLPLSKGNAYFFNTLIYNKDYNPDLIQQVLCEIFYRENKIRYVLVVQCPEYGFRNDKDRPDYYCLEQFSTIYYPFCFSAISCPNSPQIHVIQRDVIISKMRYRRALPEDNDDIVELVDNDRPDIRQQLGEYYIAEELLSESSNSLLVVTEISHVTAGFIWLNGHVDISPLVENYELDLFGNLIKFNSGEKFKEKKFVVTTARRRQINKLFTIEDINPILESLAQESLQNASSSILSDDVDEANFGTEDPKKRQLFFKKLHTFVEKLKTYDYYIQLRKRHIGIFYNIPEDQTHADFDAQSNVFVIQLFGLMESHDLRRLFRYLFTAFAAFPERDYCLLSVSVAQTMTPNLFEMLKYFIRVTPRPGSQIDEHLYLTHRSAIYGDLTLFPVLPEDIADIKQLLSEETPKTMATPQRTRTTRMTTIASRMSVATFSATHSQHSMPTENNQQAEYDLKVVLAILDNIFEDPFSKYKCFTIKCGDSTRPKEDNVTVGFVILRPFNSSWHLEKHFLLNRTNEGPTTNVAELMILKLHPLFHYQADVVFRELARQSNCWHFYHFRPTLLHCLSNDLVMSMQPLEPRRIKKLWFCKSRQSLDKPCSGREHSSQVSFQSFSAHDVHIHPIDFFQDHFAAFQNNLGHSSYFGHTMNIVILGFTDICKAFLRLLLFSWHGMGTNVPATSNCLPHVMITVICSPGIMEAEYESSFRCETCEKDEDCWLNYRNCDAFVRDVTERMDVRTWVRFVSGKVKAIDTDNHLVKLESDCEIYYETLLLLCYTDYGVPAGMFDVDLTPPANYVQINNRFDKMLCYHRLRMFQQDFPSGTVKKSIVVYGSHVRAFEFINFLVKHGVEGGDISLVMPHQVAHLQMGLMLNDSSIDTRIERILREMVDDLGVKTYERMNLLEISRYQDDGNIESVTFKSFMGDQQITLVCDFFVSYCEKYIADGVLEILEEAELDTEGSYLLVNENFQTSDPCVYAIGNFIKHRTEPNHQYRFVSPQEAAEKIIAALELNETEVATKEEKFSKPQFFQAQLPMDHYFFKVTSPKRYLANHLDNEYGFPLVTYLKGDFTRVRLNEHGMVEEIVVVTKKNKDYDFLKFFCGRHELLLNNLKSRWYLGDITSFLDFFQEPWVELIMNDHFEELQMLNKLLILPTAHEVMKLKTDRTSRRKIMRSYCQDMGVTSQLEFAFLEFIREHRSDFSTDIALPEDFPMHKQEFDNEY